LIVQRPNPTEIWPVVQALLGNIDQGTRNQHWDQVQGTSYDEIQADQSDLLSGLFVAVDDHGVPIAAIWSIRLPGKSTIVGLPTAISLATDSQAAASLAPENLTDGVLNHLNDNKINDSNIVQQGGPQDDVTPRDSQVQAAQYANQMAFTVSDHSPSVAVATALIQKTSQWIDQQDVEIAQVALAVDDTDNIEAFSAVGLNRLVELIYLISPELNQRSIAKSDNRSRKLGKNNNSASVEFQSIPPSDDTLPRWSAILNETYVQSQDCPGMTGKRSTFEAIEGYKNTGEFLPVGWLIAENKNTDFKQQPSKEVSPDPLGQVLPISPKSSAATNHADCGSDVACCILADHPLSDYLELVYFGVAPGARGQSLGLHVLNTAAKIALKQGRNRIIAAVDSKNLAAMRVYQRSGYSAIERRLVLAKFYS